MGGFLFTSLFRRFKKFGKTRMMRVMKKIRLRKLILTITLAIAGGVFLSTAMAYAEEPGYVPNEIIVKFKAEAVNALECAIVQKGATPSQVQLTASLDKLNKKYKVKKFRQIFPSFKKNQKRLEALKLKDKSLLTKKEKHLLRRLKRAPKDAKIPDLDRIYKLTLGEGQSVEETVAGYNQVPDDVEYAQPNYMYEICATPLPQVPYIPSDYSIEDPDLYDTQTGTRYWREGSWGQAYPDLWGLQKIQAIEAYNIFDINDDGVFDANETRPGGGIVVAVIDTGVDYTHEELAGNIWINELELNGIAGVDDDGNDYVDDIRGWDFVDADVDNPVPDNDPMDGDSHGTHCAGTIAAISDNEKIIGVAPDSRIMPVKGLDDLGDGTTDILAQCVYYAADNGADVLSNSWGGGGGDEALEDAFNYAYSNGCTSVAASGNDASGVGYPAGYENVISVGATDHEDVVPFWSNYGSDLDIVAPGVRIVSTCPAWKTESGYLLADGTSMATPHVSGLLALMLSKNRTDPEPYLFNSEELKKILKLTSDDVDKPGRDKRAGYGRINARKALEVTAPVPMVIIEDFNMDDTEFGNGDRKLQPGETVNFNITLKNYWIDAYSVTLYLNIVNSGGMIGPSFSLEGQTASSVTPSFIDCGDILEDESREISFIVTVGGNLECPSDMDFELTIDALNFTDTIPFTVQIVYPYQEGWPRASGGISTNVHFEPLFGDLDGDGNLEIISLADGSDGINLQAFKANGEYLSDCWPVSFEINPGTASFYGGGIPVVGDINGDSKDEIVLIVERRLYALDHEGNTLPGCWPIDIPSNSSNFSQQISLCDVDNDGALDILVGEYLLGRSYVFAYDHQGNIKPGWQILIDGPTSSFTVGDIDGDNEEEIIVRSGRLVYAFHANAEPLGDWWPVELDSGSLLNPLLADMDNNGKNDIVCISGNQIYVFSSDAAVLDGWPAELDTGDVISGLAIGDIDGNGDMEMAVAIDNYDLGVARICILRSDGSQMENFVAAHKVIYKPALYDIDSDGDQEIIIGGIATNRDGGKLYAFHHDGTAVSGWPIELYDENLTFFPGGPMMFQGVPKGTPLICDIDRDGDTEIVVRLTAWLHVFDLPNKYRMEDVEWSMYRNSKQGYGRYKELVINNLEKEYDPDGVYETVAQLILDSGENLPEGIEKVDTGGIVGTNVYRQKVYEGVIYYTFVPYCPQDILMSVSVEEIFERRITNINFSIITVPPSSSLPAASLTGESGKEVSGFSKIYSQNGIAIEGEESARSITLNIHTPKIDISEVRGEDGNVYHKLAIPDSNFLTKDEGGPQLPYISELVHIPDQAVDVSVQAAVTGSPVSYRDILVYPCPKTVIKTKDEGYQYLVEEFYFDPVKYSSQNLTPTHRVEIAEDGYFRSVRMIRVNIYPVQYAPTSKVLEFASNITVNVTWAENKDIQARKDNTSGFENMVSNLVLNYGAYEKEQQKMEQELFMQGALTQDPVTYITGPDLLDTTIDCDYLIITHAAFFSTETLADFANYRANYNNLNIVITKVDDIYAQFPNVNGNDYSIKDFIQYAYDNWQTSPRHLLIVGDIEYVPSHSQDSMEYEEWYVCVAGEDEWPDLAMGRFSIKNENHLRSIKDKIFAYEQDPIYPGDYHKRALYAEGTFIHEQRMIDILFNAGFDVTELYRTYGNTKQDFIDALDCGQNIVYWQGHGSTGSWEYPFFKGDIENLNNSNYPVVLTSSCSTADLNAESIGEEFVRADGKGAVAYYGATTTSATSAAHETLMTVFENFEYNLGKAILFGEILYHELEKSECYILLGDPALQIFGYRLNTDLPDLALNSSGVNYSYRDRQLTVNVSNIGETDAYNVSVRAFIVDYATGDYFPFGEYVLPIVPSGGKAKTATIDITPPFHGEFPIMAIVDPENDIEESFELNNQNGRRRLVLPTFIDVTRDSGLEIDEGGDPIPKGGDGEIDPGEDPLKDIAKADVDGDGHPDVYLSGSEAYETYLFLNNGDGTFSDITDTSGVGCEETFGARFGDIDNDGDPDLYVCREEGDKLFLNNGDGTFDDITVSSGLGDCSSKHAIFGDIDNDGDLDIYVSGWNGNVLFVNGGDNTFTDETSDRGLCGLVSNFNSRFSDIDGDGDLDFFIVARFDFSKVQLYLNNGLGYFREDTPPIIEDLECTSEVALSDIDLDGDLDLFFSDRRWPRLIRHNDNCDFEDITHSNFSARFDIAGHGIVFAEIDNNAGEDIFAGEYLVRNSLLGIFENFENTGGRTIIECILPIDIEGDGDLDIIRSQGRNIFALQNQTDNDNWLKIKPIGTTSNRDAIGAKVYVYSSSGELVGFQEISSQKPAPAHFGVEPQNTYKVVIMWPASGIADFLYDVTPTQLITVIEGTHPENSPPVLEPIGNKVVTVGRPLYFPVSAIDPDGDEIRYGADNLPEGAMFFQMPHHLYGWMKRRYPTLSYPYYLFYWKPRGNQADEHRVVFWVEDLDEITGTAKSKTQEEVTITVKRPPDRPPWIQFVRNFRNIIIYWRGYDIEDRFNLQYSYKIDDGEWSGWSRKRYVFLHKLSSDPRRRRHIFYVKAKDKKGLESKTKTIYFYVRRKRR
jgi:subtilisin family serine protease